jgi:hypothetical protein
MNQKTNPLRNRIGDYALAIELNESLKPLCEKYSSTGSTVSQRQKTVELFRKLLKEIDREIKTQDDYADCI